MDFSIQHARSNNVITVTTTGINPSVEEVEQEQLFGVLQVNAGGTFSGPPVFTLPTKVMQIKMDGNFRNTQTFNAQIDPLAAPKAQVYINEMMTRIITAKSEWDSLNDTITGQDFEV